MGKWKMGIFVLAMFRSRLKTCFTLPPAMVSRIQETDFTDLAFLFLISCVRQSSLRSAFQSTLNVGISYSMVVEI